MSSPGPCPFMAAVPRGNLSKLFSCMHESYRQRQEKDNKNKNPKEIRRKRVTKKNSKIRKLNLT